MQVVCVCVCVWIWVEAQHVVIMPSAVQVCVWVCVDVHICEAKMCFSVCILAGSLDVFPYQELEQAIVEMVR